jgi:ankyrin repeat protein
MTLVQGDGRKGKEAIYGWESQVRHEQEEIKEHLDRQWAKKMQRQRTEQANHALRAAAKNGDESTVRALIEAGVDVNSIGGQFHQTPLHYAAREGRTAVIQILVQAGAVGTFQIPTPGLCINISKRGVVSQFKQHKTGGILLPTWQSCMY